MEIKIELPSFLIERILHPKDEVDMRLAAAWLYGAALVEVLKQPSDARSS